MTIKPIGAPDGAGRAQGSTAIERALPFNAVSRGSRSGELTPAQKFESFVMQSFVEPMLPKADSSYFGEGTAGSIWRSMLAEHIGAEMAAAGGIGIAKMVEERNASILAHSTDALAKDAAVATGAAHSKPGAL